MSDNTPTDEGVASAPPSGRARAAAEASAALLPPRLASDGVIDMLMMSMKDHKLREQLIADPVQAAASVGVDFDLPDGVTLVVHERTAETVHLVLPGVIGEVPTEAEARELTDEQIQTTSGRRILLGDLFDNSADSKTVDPKRPGDGPNGDINDQTGVNDIDSSSNMDSDRVDE